MPTTTIYMILTAKDNEHGTPYAMFFDPFKAKRAFDALPGMGSMFGTLSWFLVHYEQEADGTLRLMTELGSR